MKLRRHLVIGDLADLGAVAAATREGRGLHRLTVGSFRFVQFVRRLFIGLLRPLQCVQKLLLRGACAGGVAVQRLPRLSRRCLGIGELLPGGLDAGRVFRLHLLPDGFLLLRGQRFFSGVRLIDGLPNGRLALLFQRSQLALRLGDGGFCFLTRLL